MARLVQSASNASSDSYGCWLSASRCAGEPGDDRPSQRRDLRGEEDQRGGVQGSISAAAVAKRRVSTVFSSTTAKPGNRVTC